MGVCALLILGPRCQTQNSVCAITCALRGETLLRIASASIPNRLCTLEDEVREYIRSGHRGDDEAQRRGEPANRRPIRDKDDPVEGESEF